MQRWCGRSDNCRYLSGHKGMLYEGGLRTPMIVRWVGHIPAGTLSHILWHYADFLPTMAELIGADTPQDLDGVSMLPTLLGGQQRSADRYFYWEGYTYGFQSAVRWEGWKAIQSAAALQAGKSLELYDLLEDEGETRDLSKELPEVAHELGEVIDATRFDSPHWPTEELE